MRRVAWIWAGVVSLACTPHEQELHGSVAPLEEERMVPAAPAKPSPPPAPEHPDDPASDALQTAPFPEVYCAYPDEEAGRWRIHIDATDRRHQRRAERLVERYPNANGVDGALARSNIPEPWRELDAVTVVHTAGVETTDVRTAGVVFAPSGGAFSFVLRAQISETAQGRGLAIAGHPSPHPDALRPIPNAHVEQPRWATVGRSVREHVRRGLDRGRRPGILARHVRWIAADLGGGIDGLMIHVARRRPGEFPSFSVIAASDGSADAVVVPIFEGGGSTGAAGVTDEAYYEPIAISDLDGDGHDEVVVRENWYEGSYDWLVRYDDDDGIVATLLCGDAF